MISERPVKVLQLVGGGDAIGGVEKMLLNYYSYMDKNKVQFDFCFYRNSTVSADQNVSNGLLSQSKVFDLRLFNHGSVLGGYMRSIREVSQIIKENNYDIIHINAGRPPLLISGLVSSKIAGAKNIIIHSHSTQGVSDRSTFGKMMYKIMFMLLRPVFRRYSTVLSGCSIAATEYMFGKKAISSPKYYPIRNAIDLTPFVFDESVRKQVRKELYVKDDTFVVGHVGSFSTPKNHLFLLDVFNEIRKRKENSRLWLAGNGCLKADVEKKVKDLNLESFVLFLGQRNDANRLYQGMDVMIFPSLWEGLSVSIVEAQSSSLPVYASTNISPEHKITDCFTSIPLSKGSDYWADFILNDVKKMPSRRDMEDQITQGGYNIEIEAKTLEQFYQKMVNKS